MERLYAAVAVGMMAISLLVGLRWYARDNFWKWVPRGDGRNELGPLFVMPFVGGTVILLWRGVLVGTSVLGSDAERHLCYLSLSVLMIEVPVLAYFRAAFNGTIGSEDSGFGVAAGLISLLVGIPLFLWQVVALANLWTGLESGPQGVFRSILIVLGFLLIATGVIIMLGPGGGPRLYHNLTEGESTWSFVGLATIGAGVICFALADSL